jgi:hypothetical protein
VLLALVGAPLSCAHAAVVELPGAAHDAQEALLLLVLQALVLGLDQGLHLAAKLLPAPVAAQDGLSGSLRALLGEVLVHQLSHHPLQAVLGAHHQALGALVGLVVLLLRDGAHCQGLHLGGACALGEAPAVEYFGVAVEGGHRGGARLCDGADVAVAALISSRALAEGVRGEPEFLGVLQRAAQRAADDAAHAAAQLVVYLLFAHCKSL